MISNESPYAAAADRLAARTAPLPDYSRRAARIGDLAPTESSAAAGWTSLAGVAGSLVTMGLVWLGARILRTRTPGDRPEPRWRSRLARPVETEGP